MKIFENKKVDGVRTIKLFGKPIYVDVNSKDFRKQSFFNGAIKTTKLRDDQYVVDISKTIEILNQPFIKVVWEKYFIKKYVFGKLICTIDLKKRFEKKYSKILKSHDSAYILNANSGETYLFLAFLAKKFFENNASKKPLFMATKKYHVDLIQMLMPDIPYVFIEKMDVSVFYNEYEMTINDKKLYLLFPFKHFKNIENKPAGEVHYFSEILNALNISPLGLESKTVNVPASKRESMLKKIKQINLNTDNFVFVAPFAYSCEKYPDDFWVELCEKLNEKGIDVFFNISKNDKDIIKGARYKTCELSFSEAFELSKMSKQIVCLRSGLTELLLQSGVFMHVIYTKFKTRTALEELSSEKVISGFGLKHLPNINLKNLKEYDTEKISSQELLESIIKEFE